MEANRKAEPKIQIFHELLFRKQQLTFEIIVAESDEKDIRKEIGPMHILQNDAALWPKDIINYVNHFHIPVNFQPVKQYIVCKTKIEI